MTIAACSVAGVTSVVFDRGGFAFHGRVQALADAARDADIVVEASRLEVPEVLVPADAVGPGALLVTYSGDVSRASSPDDVWRTARGEARVSR